jgi:hypothetical protein
LASASSNVLLGGGRRKRLVCGRFQSDLLDLDQEAGFGMLFTY